MILKCFSFCLCIIHESLPYSMLRKTIDTFYWYKLPLAEFYQIYWQTGVLKCLGNTIMVIICILVITIFLTFIRWLPHMRKLVDQLCHTNVACRGCLNTATVFRGTGRQRGVQLELSVCSWIKLIKTKIPAFISILLWKKLPGLFQGRSEFLASRHNFQFSWPDASCASWVTLKGALLAVGADGEKAETEQTTRVFLKTLFPDTRNYDLSWLPWNAQC